MGWWLWTPGGSESQLGPLVAYGPLGYCPLGGAGRSRGAQEEGSGCPVLGAALEGLGCGWEGPPAPSPPASLIPWADGSGCAPGRALVATGREGKHGPGGS